MSKDKLEALMRDNKMRAAIERQTSKYSGLTPVNPLPDIPAELEAAMKDFKKGPWHPVERRMGVFKREEKGIYTDEGTPGLFYFKATHWRYIK